MIWFFCFRVASKITSRQKCLPYRQKFPIFRILRNIFRREQKKPQTIFLTKLTINDRKGDVQWSIK